MNDSNWLWLVGIAVVGAAVLLLSGAGPEPPESEVLPYVDTGTNVVLPYVDARTNLVINECSSVRLTCEGYDPNGGRVTYHWTAEDGKGSFNNAYVLHPTYTAPAVSECCEDITLTLTVTNKHGLSASDSMVMQVQDTACYLPLGRCRPITSAPCRVAPVPTVCPTERPLPKPIVNHPPVADAGGDIVMTECTTVRLTCEGHDPDGDPVTYYWTAAGGRGTFDNPRALHPRYKAPAVGDCKTKDIVFVTLTVTDSHGASASDSLVIHVNKVCAPRCPVVPAPCPPPPSPPCITPCAAKSVDEGGSIQLYGKVWDPDCNLASYRWTADKGKFDDPTSLHPVYYAPMTNLCGGEDVCIVLTAVDGCCAKGVDQILLHISNVNHLPVADAGGDLVVNECASIQLTCSASDPDGDMLTYCWTATCDRGSFTNPCALHPVYTAPSTDRCEDEDIVLTLTVTDACGASASDSMIVHVNNATI